MVNPTNTKSFGRYMLEIYSLICRKFFWLLLNLITLRSSRLPIRILTEKRFLSIRIVNPIGGVSYFHDAESKEAIFICHLDFIFKVTPFITYVHIKHIFFKLCRFYSYFYIVLTIRWPRGDYILWKCGDKLGYFYLDCFINLINYIRVVSEFPL